MKKLENFSNCLEVLKSADFELARMYAKEFEEEYEKVICKFKKVDTDSHNKCAGCQ